MIRRRVSMPSMRGISRSRVTTSGRSSSIFFRAKAPSIAVPTTSMEESRARIAGISFRMSAESSTTRTRIRSLMRSLPAGRTRESRDSTAGTFRMRTTVPSPRIEAPLTRSLETMSLGSALMTSSSSPTRLSTTRPKRFSAAPMTMTKLVSSCWAAWIDGVNVVQAVQAHERENLLAQAQNFALVHAMEFRCSWMRVISTTEESGTANRRPPTRKSKV